jgi:hypothetical protein
MGRGLHCESCDAPIVSKLVPGADDWAAHGDQQPPAGLHLELGAPVAKSGRVNRKVTTLNPTKAMNSLKRRMVYVSLVYCGRFANGLNVTRATAKNYNWNRNRLAWCSLGAQANIDRSRDVHRQRFLEPKAQSAEIFTAG